MNREELAWAAGFFDGEGHMAARKWRTSQIGVGQSEVSTLVRFQRAVRGIGCVYGPYRAANSPRPTYRWQIASFEGCQAVIAMLWPFLSEPKRDQARRLMTNATRPHVRRIGVTA